MASPTPPSVWRFSNRGSLALERPRLIAILNATPDSFSDGGLLGSPELVAQAALRAIEAGADMLDVGGESTRPGAHRVDVQEQIRRTAPAIAAIRRVAADVPISIDTTRSAVAAAALEAGADAINDISAGRDDSEMFALAARTGAGLILMHRLREPASDAYSDRYETPPAYDDVIETVRAFLAERVEAAVAAGVTRERMVIDPGLGFGKTVEQNLALIRATPRFVELGFPVVSGLSRKSFVGRAGGLEESTPMQRVPATLALSLVHRSFGASLFRTHDVAEHARALRPSTSR